MNAAKYREVLEENLLQSARDLRPGRQLDFQHDNEPDHPAKTTLERPLVVLPKPGLEPYRKSVAKLAETYPRRLKALIAAKEASTKH
ncbi:hypothetical protein VZT92_018962 [Zoarces viviparus]